MSKENNTIKKCKWFILGVAGIFLYVVISIFCSYFCLKSTKYVIENDKITSAITIVQLTDIHSRLFGYKNEKLISEIKRNNPDIIVITGDMINAEENNIGQLYELILKLNDIAQVYVSLGNQEIEYMERTGIDLEKNISEKGAVVLNKNYRDVQVNRQKVRMGGIYGYCLPERYHLNEDEVKFLREFEATDSYKILLSHLPYAWRNYGFTADYDINLIFSGHVHGGQVIFPVIGGLYDPEFGFFPGKLKGIYYENNTVIVLSSGLGDGKEKLPRFNNIPEIAVAKIIAK